MGTDSLMDAGTNPDPIYARDPINFNKSMDPNKEARIHRNKSQVASLASFFLAIVSITSSIGLH